MAASKLVLERLAAVEKALAEAAKYNNHPGEWHERARYWDCCGEENLRGMCWKIVNGHAVQQLMRLETTPCVQLLFAHYCAKCGGPR